MKIKRHEVISLFVILGGGGGGERGGEFSNAEFSR